MIALRPATPADLDLVFPRTRALNDHEAIEISDERLRAGLAKLLANPSYGGAWLAELWIDDEARGSGAGAAVITALEAELRARDVLAMHLQVRPENPAFRLYERMGFVASPRTIMTRRLG